MWRGKKKRWTQTKINMNKEEEVTEEEETQNKPYEK